MSRSVNHDPEIDPKRQPGPGDHQAAAAGAGENWSLRATGSKPRQKISDGLRLCCCKVRLSYIGGMGSIKRFDSLPGDGIDNSAVFDV